MKNILVFLFPIICSICSSSILNAQKATLKSMNPSVYNEWREIRGVQISNDGNWVTYLNYHDKKDPILEVFEKSSQRTYIYERGDAAKFSEDNKYLVFKLHPAKDSIRAGKRKKLMKKDMPMDSLAILRLADRHLVKVPRAQAFSLPKYWNGSVFITQDPEIASPKDSLEESSTSLLIWNLETEMADTISHIDKYQIAERKPGLVLTRLKQDSLNPTGIYSFQFKERKLWPILIKKGKFNQISISPDAKKIAFLFDQDSTKIFHRPCSLYHWTAEAKAPNKLASNTPDFLNKKYRISEKGKLQFSKSGNRLFFGVAPFLVEPDTTLIDEEIVNVEVWTSKDKQTYAQQKVNLKEDQSKTFDCVFNFQNSKFIQLNNEEKADLVFQKDRDNRFAMAYDETPGKRAMTWEGFPIRKDIFSVDLDNGRAQLIQENLATSPRLSPKGKFIYFFNRKEDSWYSYNLAKSSLLKLAGPKQSNFNNELHDQPIDQYSYGSGGWVEEDDYLLAYDRYDIWQLDPTGKESPTKLTNGRAEKIIYRAVKLDRENNHFPKGKTWLFHIENENDHSEGYVLYDPKTKVFTNLVQGSNAYQDRPIQARDKNNIVFHYQSFQIFPDIHIAEDYNFKNATRISDINPQQSSYAWGSIESFSWNDYVGNPVKGLIIKPPNFDPTKKYPLLVNFYERSSHRIHRYPHLFPHRSTINYAYYANRGYVIFNPDISYLIGEPGESCYRAVMSGVDAILKLGFIDEDNMGLQGHSWGGYQIAYLLTRTNRFKCAESGAPVVNMTSAYGGIRWGSGLSRMFQYENTQSRLGATLWENHERYIKNSPLFELDKMETPVLILHNDKDGAVPWYQGIEYFMALRRLDKEAWFLNYNDEPHWPLKRQNREDFQLRMSQFFDHYLMDYDPPRWMKEGVPAIRKGIDQALELSEGK